MGYIIVYNPGQRNYFIESSFNGFMEIFMDFESAENVAKDNVDGDQIKSYEIYQLATD